MATARWKDLVIDASRPAEVAAFWADALDLEANLLEDGDWVLRGVRPERTVWINAVAEAKSVKNRVHLDLVRRSTGPLVALGGHELREVMGGGETWMVIDDPDGAELCVFDSAQGEPSAIVLDCADAVAQAAWWAEVLHTEIVPGPDGSPRWLAGVSGLPFEVWKFVPVPEPKTVKNRVHWDVVCSDVDALVTRGAAVLRTPDDEISWHVLADPEGNEFCAFAPEEVKSVTALDLSLDGAALTVALCDIESVSGNEQQLAGLIEAALTDAAHLTVRRDGNVLVAHTSLGRDERVVIAGHIDTVPVAGNLPCRVADGRIHGCGTTDMKSGVAVALRLAVSLDAPSRDVTWIFYDCEEVEADRNGLGRVAREHPEWIAGDFAVLMEPSNATVEGGCQGTMRVDVRLTGHRAHSARSWMGSNAIHAAAPVLERLASYAPAEVPIDGLVYREGLNAVGISGGVAGNVIPDECVVTVNYRFAPSRSEAQAGDVVREIFDGFDITIGDSAPGALPGLSQPAAAAFVAAIGKAPQPKFGWTDVSRFSALGVPAVNYGPGDPSLAHTREEWVDVAQIAEVENRLRTWLR